jgi:hypothetical protein
VLQALAAHLDQAVKPAAPPAVAQVERADARMDAMARRRAMRAVRVDD